MTNDRRKQLYRNVITASKSGAENEKLHPKLRAYYAGIALAYDKKLAKLEGR